jgi:hypothetical protein
MQPSYRAIFTELLTAEVAAAAACVVVAARCAELVRQECQAALENHGGAGRPEAAGKAAAAGPAQRGGGSGAIAVSAPWPADFYRAFAGLPRVFVMTFLAQYDDLRGRRPSARD